MLAIARALLTNPRVLILDEATEGLAPLIRDEIWKTVRLVRESGIATLLVDKSVSEVTALADRVMILVKGQTVFEGTPQDLQVRSGDHAPASRRVSASKLVKRNYPPPISKPDLATV